MAIISCSGRMYSGKDTVGEIIQRLTTSPWQIKKWAGPLRKVASILLGMDEGYLYTTDFKDSILPDEWSNMSGRLFLQRLGTEAIREGLHTNAWINALMSQYQKDSHWIITDTRFPNELEAVKDRGGITIRVNRGSCNSEELHPSETSLDDATFKYSIDNNGSLKELENKVHAILVAEAIL